MDQIMRASALFAILLAIPFLALSQPKIAGPRLIKEGVQDGLILFGPINKNDAYLIDNCGRVVNKWVSQRAAAHTIYLTPEGNLMRTNFVVNSIVDGGGGSGGGVEMLDWDSNLIWSYTYNTDIVRQHHDISILPNGNVLILAWEVKTFSEAVAAGRDPALLLDSELWPEHLVEVEPTLPSGGNIVWEWHAWDHLIQDFDAASLNYGVVEDHPELIDINYAPLAKRDWFHANAVDYNPELDQIVISIHRLDELWIIDHSTTSAEAASHAGGKTGKGGDILYRWGNPEVYRGGNAGDVRLFGQHDVHWIEKGLPNAGKIMYFNNGPERKFSTVEFIDPPLQPDGNYTLTAGVFGPSQAEFIYPSTPDPNFFSTNLSGAQMLPNGNLFIGSARQGLTFEVDLTGNTVWEYKGPFTTSGIVGRDFFPTDPNYESISFFRSTKYMTDYPAFIGKPLLPGEPIEGEPWADCGLVTAVQAELEEIPFIYPNPANDWLHVNSTSRSSSVRIIDMQGRTIFRTDNVGQISIPTSSFASGIYLLEADGRRQKVLVIH